MADIFDYKQKVDIILAAVKQNQKLSKVTEVNNQNDVSKRFTFNQIKGRIGANIVFGGQHNQFVAQSNHGIKSSIDMYDVALMSKKAELGSIHVKHEIVHSNFMFPGMIQGFKSTTDSTEISVYSPLWEKKKGVVTVNEQDLTPHKDDWLSNFDHFANQKKNLKLIVYHDANETVDSVLNRMGAALAESKDQVMETKKLRKFSLANLLKLRTKTNDNPDREM